MCAEKDK